MWATHAHPRRRLVEMAECPAMRAFRNGNRFDLWEGRAMTENGSQVVSPIYGQPDVTIHDNLIAVDFSDTETASKLLTRAKQLIESSDTSLRGAAEHIAAAQAQGASQRQIADNIGKPASWVNRLLRCGRAVIGTTRQSVPSRRQAANERMVFRRINSRKRKSPTVCVSVWSRDLGLLGSDASGEREQRCPPLNRTFLERRS
jgi:hypothetical protein